MEQLFDILDFKCHARQVNAIGIILKRKQQQNITRGAMNGAQILSSHGI